LLLVCAWSLGSRGLVRLSRYGCPPLQQDLGRWGSEPDRWATRVRGRDAFTLASSYAGCAGTVGRDGWEWTVEAVGSDSTAGWVTRLGDLGRPSREGLSWLGRGTYTCLVFPSISVLIMH